MRKVTVITACYNGERFIEAYAKTLLAQTYKNIEIIFVNDGSNDATRAKISQFIPEFEKHKINFQYFQQENKGQAAATNRGFQYMTGEYFMLHDIDDLLESECIEKRVEFLETYSEFGCVYSRVWCMQEGGSKKIEQGSLTLEKEAWIFNRVFYLRQDVLPIRYMFRTKFFDKVYSNRKIYEGRATQDVQVVLPMVYTFKSGFLDEFLSTYVIHEDSHYHWYMNGCKYYENRLARWNDMENVWSETIQRILSMPVEEKKNYKKIIHQHFSDNKCEEIIFMQIELGDNIRYDKDIIIFGAGTVGQRVAKILQRKGIRIKCFFDNNKNNWGKTIDGIEIKKVNRNILGEKTIILICLKNMNSFFIKQMKNQLMDLGLKEDKEFYYYLKFMLNLGYKAIIENLNL